MVANYTPPLESSLMGPDIPSAKSKRSSAKRASLFTNENKNTIKVLVGDSPDGLVSYISEAYGMSWVCKQPSDL